MKILIIGILIMGQLISGIFGKPKRKRTPYKSPYSSPFIARKTAETEHEKKMKELAKWEHVARNLKKSHPQWPQSIREIAAELYDAEERRKNK